MNDEMTVEAEIRRYSPGEDAGPRYERYVVTGAGNMRVLDVIRRIYATSAGDLAFQFACRIGRCGTCAVKVNGVPVLACQERCVPRMRIEPLTPFPVIRDLVIDRTEIEERYARLALTPAPPAAGAAQPLPMDPGLAERIGHLDSCLACMICVSACPAVAERPFDGPAFMLKLGYMHKHPANDQDRVDSAMESGLLECFGCDVCTQLCPADLSPAQEIRELRRDAVLGARSRS
ncbi:2Fe-2S iron-sulfur cluster-binding protein [Pigmentiphaga sp.]|uniref:succinate dehydrogenase/fumarate reductase iron-sulfur subunit n=1 Tax=Pigmentiphaga sp. TaxID=1977564 RepID=UPI00128CB32F|nr:2Fe-2S iron-sulfur cluster-binding protein [Pigmentiphaga sp.]MPS25765.1 succinate dehydrogenase/fumarate reductase iron-sulfur subunit [Alcaligenaceae bacterium SAGV5]MPS54417.1 succinate dehydrogenase/fumarate reductase iron-sulfur subunit [Alcaligenaceae bacterium SAGV3]MPT58557.1 succinate dehydrogenase/fumarate reductase iron-sulfur subunit [Alcaligenaceae bacterium]